jgi:hypothetical protein
MLTEADWLTPLVMATGKLDLRLQCKLTAPPVVGLLVRVQLSMPPNEPPTTQRDEQ